YCYCNLFTLSTFSATTSSLISALSLHDALPISSAGWVLLTATSVTSLRSRPAIRQACEMRSSTAASKTAALSMARAIAALCAFRSEEHTSELQSRENLVCRLLLEKKKIQV